MVFSEIANWYWNLVGEKKEFSYPRQAKQNILEILNGRYAKILKLTTAVVGANDCWRFTFQGIYSFKVGVISTDQWGSKPLFSYYSAVSASS